MRMVLPNTRCCYQTLDGRLKLPCFLKTILDFLVCRRSNPTPLFCCECCRLDFAFPLYQQLQWTRLVIWLGLETIWRSFHSCFWELQKLASTANWLIQTSDKDLKKQVLAAQFPARMLTFSLVNSLVVIPSDRTAISIASIGLRMCNRQPFNLWTASAFPSKRLQVGNWDSRRVVSTHLSEFNE